MRTFLYQLNVTRDCNLRCQHCYISSAKKAASQFMTRDQFVEIMRQIAEHLRADATGARKYGHAEIHVIGGEPTMLGRPFFEDIMPRTREVLAGVEQRVTLKMVSNLLGDETMAIARMFDHVSTSFEVETRFPKAKLQRRWEERVRALVADPAVDMSVTGAITKPVIEYGPGRLMEYFLSLGLTQIHMGFFIPSGDGRIHELMVFPPFEATSRYLIELTDWYLVHRDHVEGLAVNPIESLIYAIYYDEPSDDIVCPIIPGSLDFDWDGNTVTCIEAGGEVDVDWVGNVFETPIAQLVRSPKYLKKRMEAVSPKQICATCDEYAVCQAACSVLHKHWDGAGECPGFKEWIKYVRRIVETEGVRPKYAYGEGVGNVAAC